MYNAERVTFGVSFHVRIDGFVPGFLASCSHPFRAPPAWPLCRVALLAADRVAHLACLLLQRRAFQRAGVGPDRVARLGAVAAPARAAAVAHVDGDGHRSHPPRVEHAAHDRGDFVRAVRAGRLPGGVDVDGVHDGDPVGLVQHLPHAAARLLDPA